MADATPKPKLKPITDTKIPGTEVPDVSQGTDTDDKAKMKWMARVAVSTSIMAALAAISSSMSTGNLNQAMLQQIRAADQWSYYQAKSVKESVLEGRIETATALHTPVPDEDRTKLTQYGKDKETIKKVAEECSKQAEQHMSKYAQMSRAATAAQIGIALAAVALLLRKNVYWAFSLIAGAIAAGFMVMGLLGG